MHLPSPVMPLPSFAFPLRSPASTGSRSPGPAGPVPAGAAPVPQAVAGDGAMDAARRLLAIQAALLSHERATTAATDFVTELARQFGCARVLLGEARGHVIELVAVSNGAGDALEGESFDVVGVAMEESVLQASAVHLPALASDRVLIRLAHQRWQQRVGGAVLSVPMLLRGRVVGALACEWRQVPADLPGVGREVEDVAAFASPILELWRGSEHSWVQRLRHSIGQRWEALWHADHRVLRLALGVSGLALAGLAVVPVPHDVGARARIEGEQQRALVAPADGYLKAVLVRPGDVVRAGQVLLELADQDLLLDRQRWAGELAQQESAYAAALARADRSQMVMALGRVEQARAQLAKAEGQLQRATVVAPFDGVVLQGDLSQAVGSPVERGKVLLTLAPERRYRVVVEVDERDIGHVANGQAGQLALAALPWQKLPFQVRRVTPMAHAVEGANVFEVEAVLAQGVPALRAGLEGVAKIQVGHRTLAWIWTHRLVDWLRLRAWAWWG